MHGVSRTLRIAARPLLITVPLVLLALASCAPEQEAGFTKVAVRTAEPIPLPAKPDPPPVTAGAAGVGGGTPIIVANLPAGVTQEMVDEGQQLYGGSVCVACHGAGGAGSPVGPALNDNQWLHITGQFEEIANIITVGVSQPRQYAAAMPPMGGANFSQEQVRAIAAYVWAISNQGGQ